MTTVAVVTPVRGRLRHLEEQSRWLARSTRRPDRRIVVRMGGPDPTPALAPLPGSEVVELPIGDGPLPLSLARNRGHAAAGCDVTIFLDVDCAPHPDLVEQYRRSAADDRIVAGPVGYLPPGGRPPDDPDAWRTVPANHPAGRPLPWDGNERDEPRVELLWSLSMTVTTGGFARIRGFDEAYSGYGAEDTDLAMRAAAGGLRLRWCPSAVALHQHHAVSEPPLEHLTDIARNARTFHHRWGRWPMPDRLAAFARDGLVRWEPQCGHLEITDRGRVAAAQARAS